MTNCDKPQIADGWTEKRKGSARIHTHPEVDGAIVDRHGLGITAAAGSNVTWKDHPFSSVEDAKAAAIRSIAPALVRDEGTCRTCGESYNHYGDGYDGECPSCADKMDQDLHPENYVDGETAEAEEGTVAGHAKLAALITQPNAHYAHLAQHLLPEQASQPSAASDSPAVRDLHMVLTSDDVTSLLKTMARSNQAGPNDLFGRLERLLQAKPQEGAKVYTYDFLIHCSVPVKAADDQSAAQQMNALLDRVQITDPENTHELTVVDMGSLKLASVED